MHSKFFVCVNNNKLTNKFTILKYDTIYEENIEYELLYDKNFLRDKVCSQCLNDYINKHDDNLREKIFENNNNIITSTYLTNYGANRLPDNIVQLCNDALKLNDKNYSAMVLLGNCYRQDENYTEALECYDKADTIYKELYGAESKSSLISDELFVLNHSYNNDSVDYDIIKYVSDDSSYLLKHKGHVIQDQMTLHKCIAFYLFAIIKGNYDIMSDIYKLFQKKNEFMYALILTSRTTIGKNIHSYDDIIDLMTNYCEEIGDNFDKNTVKENYICEICYCESICILKNNIYMCITNDNCFINA